MPDPAATLTSLLRQSTIEDHDEILKAANASLKASKTDLTAQHTRVVALLKLDRFDDALRAIADGGSALQDASRLEHAYALYKTGKLDEAADVARGATARSFSHVAAQVAYRAERFDDARQIYEALASDSSASADEESDLLINSLATSAQCSWGLTAGAAAPGPNSTQTNDTFEVVYNVACGAIARGELSKALRLLQQAAKLCDSSDELSDEDKQLEMVPILVQQAYVYSKLGNAEDATKIHRQLSSYEIGEADTSLIAKNNLTALEEPEQNAFAKHEQVETALLKSNESKLFQYQERDLRMNRLALSLRAQKFPGVERETRQLLGASSKLDPSEAFELAVMNVAARSLRRSSAVRLKDVEGVLEQRPVDVGVALAAIQLHTFANNTDAALLLLETLFKSLTDNGSLATRFSPGLVALAVSLYRLQRRHSCIRRELDLAVSYWIKHNSHQSNSILRGAGPELLRSTHPADLATAGAAFEKLCSQPTQDPIAIAGLVASFAKTDSAKIQSYLDSLPAIDVLVAGTDASSLLEQGVVSLQPVASLARKRAAAADSAQGSKKKRHRRLPKDYEEGKKVDPERWLPLRDRSSYRPKGKKGKKKVADNTQGGFVREEETLELAGGAGSVKVEKAPAPSSSNNKKKKKGGKK